MSTILKCIVGIGVVVALASCGSEGGLPGSSFSDREGVARDSARFAAMLLVAKDVFGADARVDPRLLKADAPPFVLNDDAIEASDRRVQARQGAIRVVGMARTDIVEDAGCAMTGGLRPPDPRTREPVPKSEACEAMGAFVSVIFTDLREDSDACDVSGETETNAPDRVCFVAGAMEITPSSFVEYRFVVTMNTDGA